MSSPFLEYFAGIISPALKAGLVRLKLEGVGEDVGSGVIVGSDGGSAGCTVTDGGIMSAVSGLD